MANLQLIAYSSYWNQALFSPTADHISIQSVIENFAPTNKKKVWMSHTLFTLRGYLYNKIRQLPFPFVLYKNTSKAISEAEYALNPERLNIDRGALGSECHARSGLGGFSDFPTQRHGCCCSSPDFPPHEYGPRLPNMPNGLLLT